ncbi:MAG: DNA helicase RecQ [Bacteroidetes bacterium]|jgi:ATP-dependent DNA helicase RecQ|nr:DNA helicase RecQ [Bacteroidota bacterium]MBT3751124.1 DNA helicase RecQ [Bacteroidota bacterium]MBT4400015.1 DNA helicase RecQ [Bacteroidota bacterium]MBT4409606.1 DNA helicase RecQ [Bacteroidota bacterium]MBT7465384.1 DNA helicase RecQ [Bacteroidota bacterium]
MSENGVAVSHYLKMYFGFDTFKGNQEEVIQNVLAGGDSFVLMPTGGGKSLCYQLPALMMEGTGIVISPLIALMKNQVDSIRSLSMKDGIAHFMNSSLSKMQISHVMADIRSGITKLLYVAPESLTKEEYVNFLKEAKISFFAVDEAHCISEWGHDFRPEYRRIRPIIEEIGRKPILALTATATPKVQHDIQKNLGILEGEVFKSSFNRQNLYYEVRPKTDPEKQIIRFIKQHTGKSGIIYCLSRKRVEELAETLQVNDIKALAYHAGMDSATRSRNQDMFLMEEVDVIVATIAFGMGIDKPDVRFVIHYDVPKSLEGYYQETGRAGRDGGEGLCLTFYSYKDIQKLEKFMQGKPVAEQEIGRQLLFDTVSYSESSVCRRRHLLHYFGEDYHQENCENCDNCNNPKKKYEGKEYLTMALQCMIEAKEKYKPEHLASILTGHVNSAVKSYKHHHLDIFGKGKDKDSKFWQGVLRQALIAKLVSKEIENYGVLKFTAKGLKYLENPHSFILSEDHSYEEADGLTILRSGGGGAALDSGLFNMLKELRRDIARKLKLPPFVIFQDPSIEDMATNYPVTLEEMAHMTGVSSGKSKRYGKEFVSLIKKYVEENEIDRPQDMVVKSIVNKSGLKVSIIQSIDRKVSLDVIAQSKGISMDALLHEIESIVNSGTKINIGYYVDQVMDEYHQEDIFLYFKEDAKDESLEAALEELGEEEYSEEDIRLVRIKFISEIGN